MLLAGGRSGLVRLSDSLKTTLELCEASTSQLLRIVEPYHHLYREIQRLALDQLAGKLDSDEHERRTREVLDGIPEEVQVKVAHLAAHEIHSLALTSVLFSCVCLEAYVNTLAYFLVNELDLLGLIKTGNKHSATVFVDAVAGMSIRDKWLTIARLKDERGFDRSCPPFQDFQILFKFRDDQVHNKVVEWGSPKSSRPYNGKLPEDVIPPLDMGHALFAADTYWGMVQEVHRLTKVPQPVFQEHWNVSPWKEESRRKKMAQTAAKYRKAKKLDDT